jgi:V8-like Glu-specific endopeptidase
MAFPVPVTTTDPWPAVVKVIATFPSGRQAAASGVVVDGNSVLTASHVVYDVPEGGAATAVEVVPGLSGAERPFGRHAAVEWLFFEVDLDGDGRLTAAESATDVALLSFDRDLGVEAMGYAVPEATTLAQLSGYPARTKDGRTLWTDFGLVTRNGDGTLDIGGLFSEAGSSGSPVWFDADSGPALDPRVVGIVSTQMNAFGLDSATFAGVAERILSDDALVRPAAEVDIFRFYNADTGTHFYTASAAERDAIRRSLPQFRDEGNAFDATSDPAAGVAVHRFYNADTGAHFYTGSAAERDQVTATLPRFVDEGIAFHAWGSDGGGARNALHRFYNVETQTHFYTDGAAEKAWVEESFPQFRYEGVACYVDAAL